MTKKFSVRLSEEAAAQLAELAKRDGLSRAAIVRQALASLPEQDVARGKGVSSSQAVDALDNRLERIELGLKTLTEITALHARYYLAMTPYLDATQNRAARQRGQERFEVFAQQVKRRDDQDAPLVDETIGRVRAKQDAIAEIPTKMEAALGLTSESSEELSRRSSLTGSGELRISAAAEEGGSNSSFAANRAPLPDFLLRNSEIPRQGSANRLAAGPNIGRSRGSMESPIKGWCLIASVFLPFTLGCYLTFLFRSINGLISSQLKSDMGLGAADLGLVTSVYFLILAAAQVPIGSLLDRFGPRRIQGGLLLVAALGAALFAKSTGFGSLLIARSLIGLGVAAALTAGLKAITLWFPRERVALVNGYMIMFGGLGAVSATIPADRLLEQVDWRGMFELLAAVTAAVAILIFLVVPERQRPPQGAATPLGLKAIFGNARFVRLAPLSATCIGSAWSMQGLWAAPCLGDVEGFDRETILTYLFAMGVVLSIAGWLFGKLAHGLSRQSAGLEKVLAVIATLFVAAQLALILRLPVPLPFSWGVVAAIGAAPVISFAIIGNYFPLEVSARANGALNTLHFAWAFVAQYVTGLVLEQWPQVDGHYPTIAYQTAFGICVAIQLAALIWFVVPRPRHEVGPLMRGSRREFRSGSVLVGAVEPTCRHEMIIVESDLRSGIEW
ncbi:MAG: MFS transporter [Bradyrhizobium sp.]|nr:MFS transporter [Bradyrhizobium sp.]